MIALSLLLQAGFMQLFREVGLFITMSLGALLVRFETVRSGLLFGLTPCF